MNCQSSTQTALYQFFKPALAVLLPVFLAFFATPSLKAQTIVINNGQDIAACNDSTLLNVTLSYAGAGVTRTNQRCTIQLPPGVTYIAGSLNQIGGLAISQFDITDLNRPIFAVANDPSGLNLCVFNIRRKAACDAAATGQDQVTITGNQSSGPNPYSVSGNSNTYDINRAAFDFQATAITGPFAMGSNVCRPISVTNSGDGTVNRIIYSVEVSNRLSAYALYLNNIEQIPYLVVISGSGEIRYYELTGLDFDPGDVIEVTECFTPAGCDASFPAFTQHSAQLGCFPDNGSCTPTLSPVYNVTGALSPPVVINCPTQSIVLAADPDQCGTVLNYPQLIATDNCTPALELSSQYSINGGPLLFGQAVGSYLDAGQAYAISTVFTDGDGQQGFCDFTVYVQDLQEPKAICNNFIVYVDDNCEGTVLATDLASNSYDNCDPIPQILISEDGVVFSPSITFDANDLLSSPFSIEVLVYDVFGNDAYCISQVQVVDVNSPTVTCPDPITVNSEAGQCYGTVPSYTDVISDNCGAFGTVTQVPVAGTIFGDSDGDSILVNISFTDANNNTSLCEWYVYLNDNQAPISVTCPDDVTISNSVAQGCNAIYTYDTPLFSDNCSGTQPGVLTTPANTASGSVFPVGTTSVQYVLTDAGGLTASCAFTVTVVDTIPPAISNCPGNQNVNVGANCLATVTVTSPSWTDECGIDNVAPGRPRLRITKQGAGLIEAVNNIPAGGNIARNLAPGVYTYTYIVRDLSGNTSTCAAVITVNDASAPVITCAANVTVEADSLNCEYTNTGLTLNASATDNCSLVSLTHNYGAAPLNTSLQNAVFQLGTTTVIWTAVDSSGNSSTCSTSVTVEDGTSPVFINCPADTIYLGALVDQCQGSAYWNVPTAVDACGAVTVTQTMGPEPGILAVGIYPIQYTAVDESDNSVVCNFVIKIVDTQVPLLVCPQSLTIAADAGTCEWTSPEGALNPTYNAENCPVELTHRIVEAGGAVTYGTGFVPTYSFNKGVSTITYTLTETEDPENNGIRADSCSFNVTVIDQERPDFNGTCGDDLILAPEATCDTLATLITPEPIDNCGDIASLNVIIKNPDGTSDTTLNVSLGNEFSYTFQPGTSLVQYVAYDTAGNSNVCTFSVIVADFATPFVTCPADVTLATNNNCTYVVPGTELDIVSSEDNCGVASFYHTGVIAPDALSLAGGIFQLGSTVVGWVVEDAAGNQAGCLFTVTVIDTLEPVFLNCPADTITVGNFSDACQGSVVWSAPIASDNCSVTVSQIEGPVSGSILAVGTYTVTYLATDGSDNTSTCSFVINVIDTQNPLLVCPPSITVAADAGGCTWLYDDGTALNPSLSYENCASELSYTITDAFGVVTTGEDFITTHEFTPGTSEVCYTLRETEGDSTEVTCCFTVTVGDTEAPVITLCSAVNPVIFNVTSVCTTAIVLPVPVATDNCTSNLIYTAEVTYTSSGMDGLPIVTQNLGIINAAGGNITLNGATVGSYIFRMFVADSLGNRSECVVNVQVRDNTPPIFASCPGPITAYTTDESCNYTINVLTLGAVAADNCDIEAIHATVDGQFYVTADQDQIAPNMPFQLQGLELGVGAHAVFLQAYDFYGNTAACSFTITVLDTIAPQFVNCPPDTLTVGNFVDNCVGSANWPIPIAEDNCDVTVVQYAGPAFGDPLPVGFYTISYRAFDNAGNADTCTFVLRIIDTQIPLAVCPQNITVNTDDGECSWNSPDNSLSLAVGFENCPVAITWTVTNPDGSVVNGEDNVSGYTFDRGSSTVCYYLVETTDPDSNGVLSDSCCFSVLVEDNEMPTLDCQESDTYPSSQGLCTSDTILVHPQAFDNCGVEQLILVIANPDGTTFGPLNVESGDSLDYSFQVGVSVVTYIAIDSSGNTRSCSFTITVSDEEFPTLECPVAGQETPTVWINEFHYDDLGTDINEFIEIAGTAGINLSGYSLVLYNGAAGQFNVYNTLPLTGVIPNQSQGMGTLAFFYPVDGIQNGAPDGIALVQGTTVLEFISYEGSFTAVNGPAAGMTSVNIGVSETAVPEGQSLSKTGVGRTGAQFAWTAATPATAGAINSGQTIAPNQGGASSTFTFAADENCEYVVLTTDLDPDYGDNCSATIAHNYIFAPNTNTLQGSVFEPGTYVITWSATDNAGNTTSCTMTIIVEDTLAPIFLNCPPDTLTVSNFVDNCQGSVVWTVPVAQDNCGATVTQLTGPVPGTVLATGFYTITYVARDTAGNTDTCRFVLRILDTQNPLIVCPQDITVQTDPGVCQWTSPAGSLTASKAVENCPVEVTWRVTNPDGSVTVDSGDVSGYIFDKGISEVCYFITETADPENNGLLSDSCCFTVVVEDRERPLINCPESVTLSNDEGLCEAEYSWTHPVPTDNCDIESLGLVIVNPDGSVEDTVLVSPGEETTRIFAEGVTSLTYIATDSSGNTRTCNWTVTVNDDESPVIYCDSLIACNVFTATNLPLDIAPLASTSKIIVTNDVEISSVRITSLSVSNPPSGALTYTLTSPAGTTISITGTAPQGPFAQFVGENSNGNWTLTITSTATEGCGSLNAWALEICGNDTDDEGNNRLSVLKDPEVCSYTVTDNSFDVPFSDNCPGASISHNWFLGPFSNTLQGAVFPVGVNVVTWTAVDSAGNQTTCNLVIEVLDYTAPVFTNCPRPDIVEQTLDGQCGAYVNFSQPIAVDDCGGVTLTKVDATGLQSGDFFPVGNTVLRWVATDESGNTAECSLQVIVNDHFNPTITCPASVTVGNDEDYCGAVVNGLAPTVADNCTNNIGVVYKVEFPVGTVVESGVSNASGVFYEVGTSTVTYRVQDQPVLLITEVTHDINAINGGTMPVPAYMNTINGNDFTEITNLGHAALNVSGLEIVRWANNPGSIERYTIPAGTIVQPGQVVTIHWGNGTDSPANRFFNVPCASDKNPGQNQAYALIFEGVVLDVVGMNNFNPANGVIPAVTVADWTGGVGTVTNNGGIYRKYEFDNNRATDFALNDACMPGTIGTLNPTLTAMTANGTTASLQKKAPNTASCSFTVTVEDVQDPECGTFSTFNYTGGGGAILNGKVLKATINVPQNFEVGDVNLLNVLGNHNNTGHLAFKLVSPQGTTIELFKGLCAGGNHFNFGLDSDTTQFINTAPCMPLGGGGVYKPMNSLVEFNGQPSQGVWTLEIADMAGGAEGTLTGWTLQLKQRLAYAQGDTTIDNELGQCGADFSWFHPELFDNCPGGTMVVNYYSTDPTLPVPVGGIVKPGTPVTQFFAVGTTVVEYTLTDAAGNTSQCSFQVIVEDVENPQITCPADMTINLQDGECESVVSWLPAFLSDNCAIDTFYSVPATGSLFKGGTTEVTIYVVDVNGNTDSCSFNITIVPATSSGGVLACNDDIQISLGPDCLAEVTADMILEGSGYACYEYYQVLVGTGMYPNNFTPIPTSPVLTLSEVGGTFTVVVIDPATGNSCWGRIHVEDKLNPDLFCPNDTLVPCNANIDPSVIGGPILLSCEISVTMDYTDVVIDNGECAVNPRAQVIRTWVVTDESGNSSTCTQTITFDDFELDEMVWPLDRDDVQAPSIACEVVNGNPNAVDPSITGAPTILGKDFLAWDYCDASIGYEDQVLTICEGSYEILRTWTVRDLCRPIEIGVNPVTHIQIIRIKDKNGPVFTGCTPNITVGSQPYDCYAIWDANANRPSVADACGSVIKFEIKGASADNRYPVGVHVITYRAKDACGNWSECSVTLNVVDDKSPVAVCDKPTTVALLQDGVAKAYAYTFDDGSFDNCGIDSFAVRRMNPVPACGIDTKFRNYVEFCCEDVSTTPVLVVLRVFDIHGNFNDCMVEVYVQDKVPPILVCPPSITIDCDYPYDVWDLSIFGTVAKSEADRKNVVIKVKDANGNYTLSQVVGKDGIVYDNCDADITVTESVQIDNCGVGQILRSFRATDRSGLTSSCTQIITIYNSSPFYVNPDHVTQGVNYVLVNGVLDTVANEVNIVTGLPVQPGDRDDIEWPADFEATTCGQALDPANLPDGYDYPVVADDVCSLVGIGYDEWQFDIQGEACLKIIRRWKVIDWCQFNQQTGEYQTWTYDQIIKVKNTIAPVFGSCADTVICTYDENCTPAQVSLIQSATDDCTPAGNLKWTYKIDLWNDGTYDIANGQGNNASGAYPLNTPDVTQAGAYHRILWTVEDGCGNKQTCEKRFRLVDCKVPTPVCYNGLAADIMPIAQMVTVWASDFNASSYDFCTPSDKLKFSFSQDTLDKGKTFDCSQLGTNIVQMWVTDEYGNQDFCETYIIIQDNNNACDGSTAFVTGSILTSEKSLPVADADVQIIHNAIPKFDGKTDAKGDYIIGAPVNQKYEVKATKDTKPMNGVSTLDIVQIQKHILGVNTMTDIYKLIAADVNKSNNVTAADLVELRRLILGKITNFTKNTSWRMIVPTGATSLADVKEVRVIDPLNTDKTDQDFVAVKIGDVSGNADPSEGVQSTEGRGSHSLYLGLEDRKLNAGQTYELRFTADDFRGMNGYQFTLNLDPAVLSVGEITGVGLALDEENFGRNFSDRGLLTTSWNTEKSMSLRDGEVIFTLHVTALQNAQLSEVIRISSDYTQAESYKASGEVMDVKLRFNGNPALASNYELYQNVPNPFAKSTLIGFNLPKTERATLTVYDVTGKVLKVVEKTFNKGYNEIGLNKADLGAVGVLYYKLETADWTATKKMVILD